ncbi:DMT family transporter [Paenibacillus chitinolyticus]|uniref:DMT family transporter n=1 Tax=Paenibacillus chitinolyticus TaxID=79263 RepID=UPI00386C6C52
MLEKHTLYLTIAIACGITGGTFLNLSDGFSNAWSTTGALSFYFIAFLLLSFSMKVVPLSIAYAVWGGTGAGVQAIIGIAFFNENISVIKIISFLLVALGIVLINISKPIDQNDQQQ